MKDEKDKLNALQAASLLHFITCSKIKAEQGVSCDNCPISQDCKEIEAETRKINEYYRKKLSQCDDAPAKEFLKIFDILIRMGKK